MNGSHERLSDVARSGGDHAVPERDTSTSAGEPRVDPARPVDPKAAELRAEKNSLKRLGRALGPGLITGASDDDPSGIGTYAQAGAQYGFTTLWTTLWMLPMQTAVQYMCANLLASRGGRVVTREEILDAIWGTDFMAESNIVDRHIRSLRIKLQNDYRHPRFIATVPGQGYRFIPTFTNTD